MNETHDYSPQQNGPAIRRLETFSYLPPLSSEAIRAQVEYIIARGWTPAIEHTEPAQAAGSFWHMWKLPLFGETRAEAALAEAGACHDAHPGHHVRLIGYDRARQTLGAALVIYHSNVA
jgi:ribulose-bisphosphate carboxylase small chain